MIHDKNLCWNETKHDYMTRFVNIALNRLEYIIVIILNVHSFCWQKIVPRTKIIENPKCMERQIF